MQILINVPDLKKPGGVAALFNILKMEQVYPNISLFILHNKLPSIIRIPTKYVEFVFKLFNTDMVHLNPSLDRKSFLRDALFAWISIVFSKKLIIYWHGWEETFEEKIRNNIFLSCIAKHTFFKAQSTIVLGTLFERKLRALGYKNKIYIETNTAENKYIGECRPKNIRENEQLRLLFLSRLEVEKGIYIAIQTLKLLNRQKKRFKLVVAGSGTEEENIKLLASVNQDIEWAGYVTDKSKHNLLSSSQLMLFPSYYPEGMPLTIIEGMMYGMPIISRPVGGIPDIIKNEENGYLIEGLDPEEFANKISKIVNIPNIYLRMSENNIETSKSFLPEIVRERIYSYYKNSYYDE